MNNDEFVKKIQEFISAGKIDECEMFYYEKIDSVENNTFTNTLDFLFQIYNKECKINVKNIFQHTDDINELYRLFLEIKFILRRYDFGVNNYGEAMELICNKELSLCAVIMFVNALVYNKTKVINDIAMEFYDNFDNRKSLELLKSALEIDNSNDKTKYNISLVLFSKGDYELSKKFLDMISEENSETIKLRSEIAQWGIQYE